MKPLYFILALLFTPTFLAAQYYLRGDIKDESNQPVSNVKIILHSTGYTYYSGDEGGFGIMSRLATDSLTLLKDGYQPSGVKMEGNKYKSIILQSLRNVAGVQKTRLASFIKNMKIEERTNWPTGGETYSTLLENECISTSRFPETGLAINIDKASYSNIRRFIKTNSTVPPDAVRIEEMLNYFNFNYKAPPKDSVFGLDSYLTGCPWDKNNQLLFLKLCARQLNTETVAPSNLVFLIDISGSMDMPNRLPLLKSAFKLMVKNLREKDTVSVVVYGSSVGIRLQPTSGREKLKIEQAIEELEPGGATAGASGIAMAYGLAKSKFIHGGNNRVILATDGDFNIGQTSEDELGKLITQYRQLGIYLTCLGVGMGNYKDSKLEMLAKKGNGNFAYLDNEKEAEKVLVKELTQTLFAVADDAYMDIVFNPAVVEQYRLIGFDNKLNAITDSSSELEGGEVGSGHTLLAIMELVPATGQGSAVNASLAQIRLQFKNPQTKAPHAIYYSCGPRFTPFEQLENSYRFATSVVMFGSLLKKSKYSKNLSWSDVIELAEASYDQKDSLQKEFIELLEKAKKVYQKKKKD
ncbi:MAG: von Willebrand factor type A domain-containing protein [Williamsia sp.]|nr:von Willebrand factor type A domain-containing protein [Williamsia sp.]